MVVVACSKPVTLPCTCSFGGRQPDHGRVGPLHTTWAVLLYSLCLGAYLGFLFYPLRPIASTGTVYAVKVRP